MVIEGGIFLNHVVNGTLRAEGKHLDHVSQTDDVRRAVEAAYASLHRVNITHGDVAPRNICVQEDPSVIARPCYRCHNTWQEIVNLPNNTKQGLLVVLLTWVHYRSVFH